MLFSFFFFKGLVYLFMAVLGLCCCMPFSSFREWGFLSNCGAQTSHCRGFSYCGAQAVGAQAP